MYSHLLYFSRYLQKSSEKSPFLVQSCFSLSFLSKFSMGEFVHLHRELPPESYIKLKHIEQGTKWEGDLFDLGIID